jgi:hypothetical protein
MRPSPKPRPTNEKLQRQRSTVVGANAAEYIEWATAAPILGPAPLAGQA